VLGLCLAAGGQPTGPTPYYETSRLVLKLNGGPWSADGLRKTLGASLGQVGLTAVRRVGADGAELPESDQPASIHELDQVEVLACLTVTSFRVTGAEVDLVLDAPDSKDERVLVSVWWDADALRVARARQPWEPAPRKALARADRKALARLGATRLVDVDRAWDAPALLRLELALSRLSERERKVLDGVEFRRMSDSERQAQAPPGMDYARISAAFVGGDGPLRVEIYDATLDERGRFVGSLADPLPVATFDILHELGHTLARYDVRALDDERLVLLTRLQRIQERIESLRRSGGPELRAAIADNNATVQHLNALDAQILARGTSPAVTAFHQVLDGAPAPTPYGRTDRDEAFADAFALFHADPAALERANPQVHAWFARGGHLEAVGL